MEIRTSDILILAGLVIAVAIATDIARRYSELWVFGSLFGIVVFAYLVGLRRGVKRK